MKKILLLMFGFAQSGNGWTQVTNFHEAMQAGDREFNKASYKTAINFYFAAAAFMPENKGEVKEKVIKAFDAVEALRVEAEKEKKAAITQKAVAEKALAEMQKQAATAIGAKYGGGIVCSWKDSKGKAGLIVAEKDLPGLFNWTAAMDTCAGIRINNVSGWRLPTQEELLVLYANRILTGGFENTMPYWSSSPYQDDPANFAWSLVFSTSERSKELKNQGQAIRLVRDYVNN
jgi:membrane-bound inhibitor of C-type lysozyme